LIAAAAPRDRCQVSDAELLAAVAAGDTGGFRTLVERYQARFFAVARRMLGDDAEAEDAVQTALLRIYRRASAYRDDWRPSTWLYRVLTNVCIDLWRKRSRRREDAAGPEAQATVPTPDRVDVDRALARLAPEARAILLLCYVEDLSYGEIAAIRGISVNTVKTQLGRAKRAMRHHLNEVDP
jgi:RNA polymerase sigma-70 factor (ECF subfamily)